MKIAICAIIKDEQDYIEEWIEYHKKIGFDNIFLFEDIGSKPHNEIIEQYNDYAKLIRVEDIPFITKGGFHQYYTYDYFLKNYNKEYDWCAFIDIDEYIILEDKYNNDIHNFIEEYKECNGVYLFWRVFGADGRLTKCEKGKIMETYKEIKPLFSVNTHLNEKAKTIVNIKKTTFLQSVHTAKNSVNTKKDKQLALSYENAWINHYFTKSWEDYVQRMKRGDLTKNFRFIETFFQVNKDMLPLKDELTKDLNWNEFPSIREKK